MEECSLFCTLSNTVICESWCNFQLNKVVEPGVSRRFNFFFFFDLMHFDFHVITKEINIVLKLNERYTSYRCIGCFCGNHWDFSNRGQLPRESRTTKSSETACSFGARSDDARIFPNYWALALIWISQWPPQNHTPISGRKIIFNWTSIWQGRGLRFSHKELNFWS